MPLFQQPGIHPARYPAAPLRGRNDLGCLVAYGGILSVIMYFAYTGDGSSIVSPAHDPGLAQPNHGLRLMHEIS